MNAFAFFILIIGVIVVAIGGSHAFLYFTVAHFFALGDVGEYLIIAGLVTLPSAFIASIIAAHYRDTWLVRVLYYISGLWLGFVTHCTLVWILLWWGYWLARAFGYTLPMPQLVLSTGIAAVIYTIYGAWNALTPRLVEIRVRIPGLPEAWRGKTAVQLSDFHLGLVFRERFLARVMQKVKSVAPHILFITGDILDGTDGNFKSHLAPLHGYLPPWGTFFITGNHEVYLGIERVEEILKTAPLRVLNDEIAEVEGVQIIGIRYSKRSLKRDLSKVLDRIGFTPAKPSILLYHEPEQVEEMQKKGINVQLSGHTHKGQLLPFALLTWLFYKKYHHGLHRKENYTLYTSSGVGIWGPTVRTGSVPEIVVIRFE